MLPYTTMSSEDNSDAFEELESPSNHSSDDRKDSADKSATNQNEANESAANRNATNESLTNENVTNQTEVNNKPLVFKLAWPMRDEISSSLNRYTQVLCGEKAEGALAKDKLMNDSMNLFQVLLNLQPKSDAGISAGSRQSGRVTLDLDSDLRSQIVTTLLANHSLLVSAESASEENQMKMIEQSSDLVAKLAKLPFGITTGSPDDDPALDDKADQLAKRASKHAEEVARLNRIIDDQKSELTEKATKHANFVKKVASQKQTIMNLESELIEEATKHAKFSKKVAGLNLTIENLKSELIDKTAEHAEFAEEVAELKQTIKDQKSELIEQTAKIFDLSKKVDEYEKAAQAIEEAGVSGKLSKPVELPSGQQDLNRKAYDFEYELNGAEAFIESNEDSFSKLFYAEGLAWYLQLNLAYSNRDKCLSIYLYQKDVTCGSGNYSIDADCKLSIINQSELPDNSYCFKENFCRLNTYGGLYKFICSEDLKSRGFIKDDKIRVRAELKLGKLVRTE